MIEKHEGFTITATLDETLGGWTQTSFFVLRDSDGFIFEDNFTTGSDRLQTIIEAMKKRIDEAIRTHGVSEGRTRVQWYGDRLLPVQEWCKDEDTSLFWHCGHLERNLFFASADVRFQQSSSGTLEEDLMDGKPEGEIERIVEYQWWRFHKPEEPNPEDPEGLTATVVTASTPGAEPVTVLRWP